MANAPTPTTTFNAETGEFSVYRTGEVLSVKARRRRGRWQYVGPNGKVIASGMEPAEFVAYFWYGILAD